MIVNNETIGYCELCGVLDHHLIHGECRVCRDLFRHDGDPVTSADYQPSITLTTFPPVIDQVLDTTPPTYWGCPR